MFYCVLFPLPLIHLQYAKRAFLSPSASILLSLLSQWLGRKGVCCLLCRRDTHSPAYSLLFFITAWQYWVIASYKALKVANLTMKLHIPLTELFFQTIILIYQDLFEFQSCSPKCLLPFPIWWSTKWEVRSILFNALLKLFMKYWIAKDLGTCKCPFHTSLFSHHRPLITTFWIQFSNQFFISLDLLHICNVHEDIMWAGCNTLPNGRDIAPLSTNNRLE